MGSFVANVKKTVATLIVIIGLVLIAFAIYYWGSDTRIAIGSTAKGANGLSGWLGSIGIGSFNYLGLLSLGLAAIFAAYVIDDEAAAEVIGIPLDVVEDIAEDAVEVVASTTSTILDSFGINFTTLALGAGAVYLTGKVLE